MDTPHIKEGPAQERGEGSCLGGWKGDQGATARERMWEANESSRGGSHQCSIAPAPSHPRLPLQGGRMGQSSLGLVSPHAGSARVGARSSVKLPGEEQQTLPVTLSRHRAEAAGVPQTGSVLSMSMTWQVPREPPACEEPEFTPLPVAALCSAVDLIRSGGKKLRFLVAKSDMEIAKKISSSSSSS